MEADEPLRALRWAKLRRISGVIYPTTSPYGRPHCMLCADSHMLVGTESADVLVFDYANQDLVKVLRPRLIEGNRWGPTTSLAISTGNRQQVAAGYAFGGVVVWDLSKGSVILVAPPLTEPPPLNSTIETNETHIIGTPVRFVQFCVESGRSPIVISGDERGVVVMHKPSRTPLLLERSVHAKSWRLIGRYASPTTMFGCAVFGGEPNRSFLLAALSSQTLVVLKFELPHATTPKVLLKVPRSMGSADTGHMKWNPATNQLVWSWDAELSVLRLTPAGLGIEYAFSAPWNIEFVNWIDPHIMTLLLRESTPSGDAHKLAFVRTDTLDLAAIEPLLSPHFIDVGTQASTVFILGRHELVFGTPPSWADRLMNLLNKSQPVNAVRLAEEYYLDKFGFAAAPNLVGLPLTPKARQAVVRKTVPDLVLTSLRYAMEHDPLQLSVLLPECVRAVIVTRLPMLEPLLELVIGDEKALHLFLDEVTDLILSDPPLQHVPPPIFKSLAAYLPTDVLERVFYTLDTESLDLDQSFALCRQYSLVNVATYLSTEALHDYVTPLTGPESPLLDEYLAATLRGQIFPTMEDRPEPWATQAKNDVYATLFTRSTDLLESLLHKDADALLRGLDAGFEDSFLNSDNDAGVSRQVVVNTLLHTTQPDSFIDMFVARNVAKFRQFILLSGNRMEEILERLCISPSPYDQEQRELAILALLSVYSPLNVRALINMLSRVGYRMVLERVLLKRHQYIPLVKLHLEADDGPSVWPALIQALRHDRPGSVQFVQDFWTQLIELGAEPLARICAQFGLTMWQEKQYLGTLSVDFLNGVFATSDQKPSQSICTLYVQLMTENRPEGLLQLLRTRLTSPTDVSVPAVVDTLLAHGREDALAYLLGRLNRWGEAMIYIANRILDDRKVPNGFSQVAIEICQEGTKADYEEGLQLWKRLLTTLLDVGGDTGFVLSALADSGADIVDVVSEVVVKSSPSFRPVVGELLRNLRLQQTMLRAINDVLDSDTYVIVQNLMAERRRGWAVSVNSECEGCGANICGIGVDASVLYQKWEEHMRDVPTSPVDGLIAFACHHSFHYSCLVRLSGGTHQCIICEAENNP